MKKIKKTIVRFVVFVAQYFYENKKYTNNQPIVKVNLGCGLTCLPDWINVDGSLTSLFGSKKIPFINKVLYKLAGSSDYFSFGKYNSIVTTCDLHFYDLSKGVPIQNNYANFIYCSHFLEHLTKSDGKKFLEECHRSLKKDGLLRISVPDLDYAFEMYKDNKIEDMMGLFFFTSDDWGFTAHKYGYNFAHLKEILEDIGFTAVEKRAYHEGECPDITSLDVYPDHSLFVECKK